MPFLNSEHNEAYPEFSPDGRWLAYASDESGRYEVYVRAFLDKGLWRQISLEGGVAPVWSRSGRELYFQTDGKVWVVNVTTSPILESSRPHVLLVLKEALTGYPIRSLDIWPGSGDFLLEYVREADASPVTRMTLVQNWFEELRRLCPTAVRK